MQDVYPGQRAGIRVRLARHAKCGRVGLFVEVVALIGLVFVELGDDAVREWCADPADAGQDLAVGADDVG